jgi:glucose-1-phosphate cytidylyltransferase
MKVVLFCGGAGTRLREASERLPKPLMPIGNQPLLWHLMRYYEHFGHDEFILCAGYGAEHIEEFLGDSTNRRVSLVDTGEHASIGERLRSVAGLVEGDEMFLANYSDGLTDLALPEYVDEFSTTDAVGSFLAVHPSQSFHSVVVDDDGAVTALRSAHDSDLWINGGFFVFRKEIFDFLYEGEDLVDAPFQRLIAERRLLAYKYDGFWACLDTYKDKLNFDALHRQGLTPWMVWKS